MFHLWSAAIYRRFQIFFSSLRMHDTCAVVSNSLPQSRNLGSQFACLRKAAKRPESGNELPHSKAIAPADRPAAPCPAAAATKPRSRNRESSAPAVQVVKPHAADHRLRGRNSRASSMPTSRPRSSPRSPGSSRRITSTSADEVRKGQVLAEIFVPELNEQHQQMVEQVKLDKQCRAGSLWSWPREACRTPKRNWPRRRPTWASTRPRSSAGRPRWNA